MTHKDFNLSSLAKFPKVVELNPNWQGSVEGFERGEVNTSPEEINQGKFKGNPKGFNISNNKLGLLRVGVRHFYTLDVY